MKPIKTYACYSKNLNERLHSSSGALFSVLAKYFLSLNGVVYGVALTDDCYGAEFIAITDKDELQKLRGSKYFQAKVGNTFEQVKHYLEEGRLILFSGTGCQINGLKCYLNKSYDNLFCVDVICHGVPSPKLWRLYTEYQESKFGKLKSVNFRCKDNSWKMFGMKENEHYTSKDDDPFMRMFLRNYCLRPACYECHAKSYKLADITIADFWGIEEIAPDMNDGNGTSLVITRTQKGQQLFDHIKNELKLREVSYEEGVRGNSAEYSSAKKPTERNLFFEDMNSLSFDDLKKKYAADPKVSFIRKIGRTVKKCAKTLRGGKLE